MMDQRRVESLKRRYGNHVSASQPAMGARGHGHRHGAQRMAGKPQNTKATVKRLMSYLEQYKLGMGLAFFCVIINTVASLAGSYMLRPIINTYIDVYKRQVQHAVPAAMPQQSVWTSVKIKGLIMDYIHLGLLVSFQACLLYTSRCV